MATAQAIRQIERLYAEHAALHGEWCGWGRRGRDTLSLCDTIVRAWRRVHPDLVAHERERRLRASQDRSLRADASRRGARAAHAVARHRAHLLRRAWAAYLRNHRRAVIELAWTRFLVLAGTQPSRGAAVPSKPHRARVRRTFGGADQPAWRMPVAHTLPPE